jgi:hypothetical protein
MIFSFQAATRRPEKLRLSASRTLPRRASRQTTSCCLETDRQTDLIAGAACAPSQAVGAEGIVSPSKPPGGYFNDLGTLQSVPSNRMAPNHGAGHGIPRMPTCGFAKVRRSRDRNLAATFLGGKRLQLHLPNLHLTPGVSNRGPQQGCLAKIGRNESRSLNG